MKQMCFRSVVALFVFAAALQGQSRESLIQTVSEASNWSPAGSPADYDETTLSQLSATIAPVASRYGLIGVTVQDWQGPSGSVRSTLYEMLDSASAYGLFAWQRTRRDENFPVGAEGFRSPSGTTFWQSKYVVTLSGPPPAVQELSRVLSERILGQSRKAPVSELLPPAGLVSGSEKYVLSPDDINPAGLDPATLGFIDSVEVATARYEVNGSPVELMLLLYPTQQVAKKYGDALPSSGDQGVFHKRVSALVAVVSGARSAADADSLLANVNYESKVTWNEPNPGLALGPMIVTIFTFIGVALAFTIVVGISFGGLRLFVKGRYPNRVFDRAQDMEIIQLKLTQGLTRPELHE